MDAILSSIDHRGDGKMVSPGTEEETSDDGVKDVTTTMSDTIIEDINNGHNDYEDFEVSTITTTSIISKQNKSELSVRAILLMVTIGCILSSANTYVGLFSGFPISASIPSAIISLSIIRFFNMIRRRKENPILEINLIQTGSSAGSVVSGSSLITIPALVQLGYWQSINFWETTCIVALGSILGIFFSIPLRKTLIKHEKLKFPEGTATAVVLETLCESSSSPQDGDEETGSRRNVNTREDIEQNNNSGEKINISTRYALSLIVSGAIIGALFKFCEVGLSLWNSTIQFASFYGTSSAMFYASFICSPALLAIGYIVELNIGMVVFSGAVAAFWIGVPIASAFGHVRTNHPDPKVAATFIFEHYIRYMGVGAMAIGSLLSVISLSKSLWHGILAYINGIKTAFVSIRTNNMRSVLISKRDDDIPVPLQFMFTVATIVAIGGVLIWVMHNVWIGLLMTLLVTVAGFMFAAASGYMAGIVGSSNNPISGITLATVLIISLLLFLILGKDGSGPAKVILVAAFVACASAHSSDNMQDLKTGELVGASAWKQQVVQLLGIIGPSMLVAPVMILLSNAYGIGLPSESHPNPLSAPQARLLGDVAKGVFSGDLPWRIVGIGMCTAVIVAVIDLGLRIWNSPFRIPVLGFATGLYLPFDLSVPLIAGGFLSWVAKRHIDWYMKRKLENNEITYDILDQKRSIWEQVGMLMAAGLITGESLVGVLMAIPIVITGNTRVFAVTKNPINLWWLSVSLLAAIFTIFYIIRVGVLVPLTTKQRKL